MRKPTGQRAISRVSLQFLGRHPFECFSKRRIFKFDGLSQGDAAKDRAAYLDFLALWKAAET
jgi:hypothetical protein